MVVILLMKYPYYYYIFGYGDEPNDRGWHIDEPTCQLLRVNIPLQTSDDYIMQWNDKDYHLEIGKAYLWNTRIKHRPTITRKVQMKEPRINVVLGLTPWLNYDTTTDKYTKNESKSDNPSFVLLDTGIIL